MVEEIAKQSALSRKEKGDSKVPSKPRVKKPKTRKYFWLQVAFACYSLAAIGQAWYSVNRIEELIDLIHSNITDPRRFDVAKDHVVVIMKYQKVAPYIIGLFVPCTIASIIEVLLAFLVLFRILRAFAYYGVALCIRFLAELIALILYPTLLAVVPVAIDIAAFPIIYHLLNEISLANSITLKIQNP